MPKIIDGASLAAQVSEVKGQVFVEIRAAQHIFYAKAFRANLVEQLHKLPENVTSGLHLVEYKGNWYLSPTNKLLKAMKERGFPKAHSLKGSEFVKKLQEDKKEVFVKVPTLAGEMRVKIAKQEFAQGINEKFPEDRIGMRIYSQTSGEMLVRAF